MVLFARNTAFSRVTALAARRQVHAAFAWMHNNPRTIMDWQTKLVAIPAPPFGEMARAAWISERFIKAGLSEVNTDGAGNVIGLVPAKHLPAESSGPVVVLSAHLDTVFPADTLINARVVETDGCLRLEAPGASDNGAGVAGMLALAHTLIHAEIELPLPLVVIGNVGEEGEGDLRGIRHFYNDSILASRVAAHIVLDGAGADSAQRVICPATLILGERDMMTPVRGGRALAAMIAGATAIVLPGAGHMLMTERPDEVLRALDSHNARS